MALDKPVEPATVTNAAPDAALVAPDIQGFSLTPAARTRHPGIVGSSDTKITDFPTTLDKNRSSSSDGTPALGDLENDPLANFEAPTHVKKDFVTKRIAPCGCMVAGH
ncbi:hypothetical protein Dda_8223 [Drechslerella dactyloides]|uniref:Uncharacterized protein n=1 Tax=Drechslerella dactyloides TaxID=74499 RepID=A0AAD6NGG2_DREDA|nr:hypothetical protein Dda_8223 [Drechslerella dactyloides]